MNMLGTNQDKIDVKTKSESDGSSVICANQYTKFTKRLSSQQMLTCELFTDDRSHSTLSSLITIKGCHIRNKKKRFIDFENQSIYFRCNKKRYCSRMEFKFR